MTSINLGSKIQLQGVLSNGLHFEYNHFGQTVIFGASADLTCEGDAKIITCLSYYGANIKFLNVSTFH